MRALVLSGGGVKGAYQVGVLRHWMVELGREYEILCGVSVGALNAATLCSVPLGHPAQAWTVLADEWQRVTPRKVRRSWPVFGAIAALWKPSVLDSAPLRGWIRQVVSPIAIKASGRKLRVGAVCWETGESGYGSEDSDNIAEWVCASSAFPVIFSPVEIGGRLYTDGGVKAVTPLGEAIRLGADEIDVIMCSNPELPSAWAPDDKAAVPGYLLRVLDLMSDALVMADLKVCGLKNDLAQLNPRYRAVKINLVLPRRRLVENALDFDPDVISALREEGYRDAIERVVHLGLCRALFSCPWAGIVTG